jgi:hypothetical protein
MSMLPGLKEHRGDIHFTRSTDNGVSFEAVKNLSNNSGTSANVALDGWKNIWVVWNDSCPRPWMKFYSRVLSMVVPTSRALESLK